MSMGYGGRAHLVQEDDTMLMYVYCCYNINDEGYEKFMEVEDGEIYIAKDVFVEADIHKKIKKVTSGHKKIVEKRVQREVSFTELLEQGKVTVKNASGTWQTGSEDIDVMALKLIRKLFDCYQNTGDVSETVSWYS